MPKYSRRQLARGYTPLLANHPAPALINKMATRLITDKMTHQVDQFIADVTQELSVQRGHLFVTITTARKLSRALTTALVEKLRRTTGAITITTQMRVDPAILGGFIARTPQGEFDASIRYKLNRLKATS